MMSLRAAGSTVWLGLVSVSWVGSWRFTVSVYCWGRPKFTIRSSSLRRIAPGAASMSDYGSPHCLEHHLCISSRRLFRLHVREPPARKTYTRDAYAPLCKGAYASRV